MICSVYIYIGISHVSISSLYKPVLQLYNESGLIVMRTHMQIYPKPESYSLKKIHCNFSTNVATGKIHEQITLFIISINKQINK